MNCYKVTVKTTNSMRDTYCITPDETMPGDYFDCEDGAVFVVAETVGAAIDLFPGEIILTLERVGIGRCAARAAEGGEDG